jgi:cytochrome c biogenesis protein CcmG/thiol:disulfide interchange protein DsbE
MVLAVFLWQGLSLDPHRLPYALLNKAVPMFTLSTVQKSDHQFTEQNLRGKISLLNVWAS